MSAVYKSIVAVEGSIQEVQTSRNNARKHFFDELSEDHPQIDALSLRVFNEYVEEGLKISEEKDLKIATFFTEIKVLEMELEIEKESESCNKWMARVNVFLCIAVITCVAISILGIAVEVSVMALSVAAALNMVGEFLVMYQQEQSFNLLAPLRGAFYSFYLSLQSKEEKLLNNIKIQEESIRQSLPILKSMCNNLQARQKIQDKVKNRIKILPIHSEDLKIRQITYLHNQLRIADIFLEKLNSHI